MRRVLHFLLFTLTLTACGEPECPYGELTGDELPCTCEGELVEALPGDGSYCSCTDEGFECFLPSGDTGDQGPSTGILTGFVSYPTRCRGGVYPLPRARFGGRG